MCIRDRLNPLFNPVWTALLVHEYPGPLTLAGFGIVLVSITLWTLSNARDKAAEQAKTCLLYTSSSTSLPATRPPSSRWE